MKILSHHITRPTRLLAFLLCSALLFSCQEKKQEEKPETTESKAENAILVVSENMEFQVQDTIPSGWNLLRYKNFSSQTHFILIDVYPEGKTLDTVRSKVIPYFDSGMKLLNEGKTEEGFAEFSKLPEWFEQVSFHGGTGLISPGQTAETMLYLEPGEYFMECYVKMENGIFHASMGMIEPFVVSEEKSGEKELSADIEITISSTEGIVFNDSIGPGDHVFSVAFKDQIVHENFAGHDVNLVRMEHDADPGVLEQWMNWVDPKGLIEPSPPGFIFLGGVNNMPAGNKGYFKAHLQPGTYALISEVPEAGKKNMLKIFTIGE